MTGRIQIASLLISQQKCLDHSIEQHYQNFQWQSDKQKQLTNQTDSFNSNDIELRTGDWLPLQHGTV